MKTTGIIIAGFIGAIAIVFILGITGLGFDKFFKPRQENIRREVFEETQSFVHGKTQDLARFYEQYQKAEPEEQAQIKVLVQMQLADFDETDIRNPRLRAFLTKMRGY